MNGFSAIVVFMGFVIGFLFQVNGQESPDFKFVIQAMENRDVVVLVGGTGCSWPNLMFSLEEEEVKFVDDTGVYVRYDLQNENEMKMPNPLQKGKKKFIISFAKEKGVIKLIGHKGTEWEEEEFTCNSKLCRAEVDRNAITPLDQ